MKSQVQQEVTIHFLNNEEALYWPARFISCRAMDYNRVNNKMYNFQIQQLLLHCPHLKNTKPTFNGYHCSIINGRVLPPRTQSKRSSPIVRNY